MELLEIQMKAVQDELSDLEGDVDFLFDETVIRDGRIFQLEIETEGIEENVESKLTQINPYITITNLSRSILDCIRPKRKISMNLLECSLKSVAFNNSIFPSGLQATDISLDARVTALEDSGTQGNNGESCIHNISL